MHPINRYMARVLDGKIRTCKYTRLAVERHERDLKRKDLIFDMNAAQFHIDMMELMPHVRGRWATQGETIKLEDWQQFIIGVQFGYYWKKTGKRRFTTSYKEMGKKNAKTTMAAGLGIIALIAGEFGAEVYSAATKRDQAKICFDMAEKMVKKSPHLINRIACKTNNLSSIKNGSKFEPLTAEAVSEKQEGLACYYGIIDEYHAWKSAKLYGNMEASSGIWENPMIDVITTAGFNLAGPCFKMRQTAIQVLEGKIKDDSTFAIIYTLDPADDWEDPKNWIKANPNLNVSFSLDYLKGQFVKAKNQGASMIHIFKTKHLSMWEASQTGWIDSDHWKKCNKGAVKIEDYAGREAFIGIDLANKLDIAAIVALIPPDETDDIYTVFRWLFIPEDIIKDRNSEDGVNYRDWAADGHIITTPGNSTDYDTIKKYIHEVVATFTVNLIGYDPWNATMLIQHLIKEGIPAEYLNPLPQTFAKVSEPTKELEKDMHAGRVNHQGCPVLSWMNGNAIVIKNSNNDVKLDKGKSIYKIDGLTALVIAKAEEITFINKTNVIEVPPEGLQFIKI